jgi:phage-related protein
MPKIGDVWVDGDIRWDNDNIDRIASNAGTSAGDRFSENFRPNIGRDADFNNILDQSRMTGLRAGQLYGEGWQRQIQQSISQSDDQFNVHMNRQIQAYQNLERQRTAAAEDTNRRLAGLRDEINRGTQEELNVRKRAESDYAAHADRQFKDIVSSYSSGLNRMDQEHTSWAQRTRVRFQNLFDGNGFTTAFRRVLSDGDTDVDRHSRGWGSAITSHVTSAFSSLISILPGRLEGVFTNSGPVIGTALLAGVAGAIAIGAPALGAMFTGLFMLGIGGILPLAGALFVGMANDPRVHAGMDRIKETFMNKIIKAPEMQNIGQMLTEQLDKVNAALGRWAPTINSILQAGARFFGPITDGLIGMVDAILPAINRLANSQFMTELVKVASEGLVKIGQAINAALGRFLDNPEAISGAIQGLRLFFNLIAGGIGTIIDFAAWLSVMWARLNKDPDGAGPNLSIMGQIRQAWHDISEDAERVRAAAAGIWTILTQISGTTGQWKADLKAIGDIWNLIHGRGDLQSLQNTFKELLNTSPALAAVLAPLINAIDLFKWAVKEVPVVWSKAWNGVKTDAINIWNATFALFRGWIQNIQNWFNTGLDWVKNAWSTAWNWVKDHVVGIWNTIVSWISNKISEIGQWISNKMQQVQNLWNLAWDIIKNKIPEVWNAIIAWVGGKLTELGTWILTKMQQVQNLWNLAWDIVKNKIPEVWNAIVDWVVGKLGELGQWILTKLEEIKGWWTDHWNAIKDWVVNKWNEIVDFVVGKLNDIGGFILGKLNEIRGWWTEHWNAIKDWVVNKWNEIVEWVTNKLHELGAFILGKLTEIKQWWTDHWNQVKDYVVDKWNEIKQWVTDRFNEVVAFILLKLGEVKRWWEEHWQAVLDWVHNKWEEIKNLVNGAIEFVRTAIETGMARISEGWNKMWAGVSSFLGGIWVEIENRVATGMNKVIDVLNKGIEAVNAVLSKLGVDFKIDPIGHVGGGAAVASNAAAAGANLAGSLGHASGGRIGLADGGSIDDGSAFPGGRLSGPGHGTADLIPTRLRGTGEQGPWVSNDEYVVNARASQSLGYDNLEYMNRYGKFPNGLGRNYVEDRNSSNPWGLAGGAKIVWRGANGDNESLMEAHRNHVHVAMSVPPSQDTQQNPAIVAAMGGAGVPLNPVSGFRAGSTGSGGGADNHSKGIATDFGGFEQDALAEFAGKAPGVIELIHRTNKGDYGIFGGGGSILNEFLAKGIDWVMGNMVGPSLDGAKGLVDASGMGNTAIGQMAKGVLEKLKEGLKKKIENFIKNLLSAAVNAVKGVGGKVGSIGGGVEQWRGLGAQALQMLGMPADWITGLLAKMTSESNGDPNAVNNTDINAQHGDPSRGLMQVIGSTFRAYALPGYDSNVNDPLSNILAALRYIQARYGGVPGLPAGGYDNGGILPHGGLAINTSNKPEMVLTSSQASALEEKIRGMSGASGGVLAPNINVYVDGVLVASKVVVEENNRALVSTLKRGRG